MNDLLQRKINSLRLTGINAGKWQLQERFGLVGELTVTGNLIESEVTRETISSLATLAYTQRLLEQKGEQLRTLAEKLGISIQEAVIVALSERGATSVLLAR
jgi:uncharacterized coiled-coil protein SlyX